MNRAINFKDKIEKFTKNNEQRESVVLALMNKTETKHLHEKFKTTRANINLIKNNFIDTVYKTDKTFFDDFFVRCEKEKVVSIENPNQKKYKNIIIAVLQRKVKQSYAKTYFLDEEILIQIPFYDSVIKRVNEIPLPIELDKIAQEFDSTKEKIFLVLEIYKRKGHSFYYDHDMLYTIKAGANKLIDAFAQSRDADLPKLYQEIKKTIKELPNVILTFEKFKKIVEHKLANRRTAESFYNFLRIHKGAEGIVTRRMALRIHNLDELIVEELVLRCIEIAKTIECQTDTEYLLAALEKKEDKWSKYKLNPVLLKSILVVNGEFEQGRKYNVILKSSGCSFKRIDELIEDVFNKTGKDKMRAKDIYDNILKSGKSLLYTNFQLSLRKHFLKIESNNKKTGLYSRERI